MENMRGVISGIIQFISLLWIMLLFVGLVVLRIEHPDMTSIRFAMEYWPVYALMASFWFIYMVGRGMK